MTAPSAEEIARRRALALAWREALRPLFDGDLAEAVPLGVFNGSLVRGRAGRHYDIDWLFFLRVETGRELLDELDALIPRLVVVRPGYAYRRDLHLDGHPTFAAHAHLDAEDHRDPPIGIHGSFVRDFDSWRSTLEAPYPAAVVDAAEAWAQRAHRKRIWVDDAMVIVDAKARVSSARAVSLVPPPGLAEAMLELVTVILRGRQRPQSRCAMTNTPKRHRWLMAVAAYLRAGQAPGRPKAYADDADAISDPVAAALLRAAASADLDGDALAHLLELLG